MPPPGPWKRSWASERVGPLRLRYRPPRLHGYRALAHLPAVPARSILPAPDRGDLRGGDGTDERIGTADGRRDLDARGVQRTQPGPGPAAGYVRRPRDGQP